LSFFEAKSEERGDGVPSDDAHVDYLDLSEPRYRNLIQHLDERTKTPEPLTRISEVPWWVGASSFDGKGEEEDFDSECSEHEHAGTISGTLSVRFRSFFLRRNSLETLESYKREKKKRKAAAEMGMARERKKLRAAKKAAEGKPTTMNKKTACDIQEMMACGS
jgi:hypothetical protein